MSFNDLGLRAELLGAVDALGYTTPTPIQANAIPVILKGHDILAGAQTGTGKTAAFTLPVLQQLSNSKTRIKQPRALILAPTRELAAQVAQSVELYGKKLSLRSAVVFGGVGIKPQIARFRSGVDILVATPGRLLDHASQKTVDLSHIEIFVLDEADRMLDMGFIHDIRRIMKLIPSKRQNLMFSATYSSEIKKLADTILTRPKLVEVARRNTTAESVTQRVHEIPREHKRYLLSHLIKTGDWSQVLVFTRTKHGANRLTKQLKADGVSAAAIHGDKSQSTRTRALDDFKKGTVRTLVATDIAARGLDIVRLPFVVNFDLPHVPEDYVHRIGRTGRAGADGVALSLVCPDEQKQLMGIQKLLKCTIPVNEVEGFTFSPKNVSPSGVKPVNKKQGQRTHKPASKQANPRGKRSSALTGAWFASR